MPVNETSVISKPKPKPKGKRTPPEKESKSVIHGSEAKPKTAETTPVASTSVQKVPPIEWFTTEIQSMMYGFGDCRRPLLESAQLVEEIVHQQMNSLLVQASEIASGRGARFIGSEDIIFLLRKDKVKLSRLLKYLEVKDLKAGLLKGIPVEEELGELTDGSVAGEAKAQPQRSKRVKLCSDFLSSIDQTGELTTLLDEEIFDEVKAERLLRKDRQTRCMDQTQYLDYAEARQMTFCRKYRTTKFRDWLLKDNLTDVKPNALAIELFNYLAFETVAQIVDLALLVKQDALEDPFSRLHPTAICNTEYPSVQMAGYNVRTTTNASETLSQTSSSSPPSSPASQAGGSHPQTASAQPSIAAKPKPKKVKKTVGKAPQEFPGCKCIQPADIREAIRRYWRESGPFLLFSKVHRSNMPTRLLCC